MIDEHSDDVGTSTDIDEQISDWMRLNFDWSDYYDNEFDIHDHSYEIGTMIDDHIEEKEEDDSKFRDRVKEALADITVGVPYMTFDIK